MIFTIYRKQIFLYNTKTELFSYITGKLNIQQNFRRFLNSDFYKRFLFDLNPLTEGIVRVHVFLVHLAQKRVSSFRLGHITFQ